MVELLIGFMVGLVVGPLIRSYLAWREYAAASLEARLHEEMFRRMSAPAPLSDAPRTSSGAPVG